MTIELQRHHLALYAALLVVVLILAGIFHQWRLDGETAKAKAAAQDQIIAAADKRDADRQKQFDAQLKTLQELRATPTTTPQQIIERIPQLINFPTPPRLEPEMAVVNGQLQPPKPDAPKINLVLTPDDQRVLNNTLVDCKTCQLERDKLKADIGEAGTKFQAMTKERDDWKTAAKGGSLWTRVKRRLRDFIVDAAILEGARCAMGHC